MNYMMKIGLSLLLTTVVLGGQTLFKFDETTDPASVQAADTDIRVSGQGLHVHTGTDKPWPGITLKAPGGHWDLKDFQYINVDLHNPTDRDTTVVCRVDNAGADGQKNCLTRQTTVSAGESQTLTVSLHGGPWALSHPVTLIGMRGCPGQQTTLDPAAVTQILLFVNHPKQTHQFVVKRIHAEGQVTTLNADTLLPLLDRYGQFRHRSWPGKLHTESAWIQHRQQEQTDLDTHPGPKERTQYGGWSSGPKLEATGFFRVQKVAGQWWLVDPEGRLFWSHGVDCVGPGTSTPITDRTHYFEALPESSSTLARFYGQGSWAPHGYYKGKRYETFNFTAANLLRKYGDEWKASLADVTHRRLRSWGMNTIGNWSSGEIYLQRRTAYVATVNTGGRTIAGSKG
ncbi:MAG: beta-agarase, partial [Planctomycetes bacterium]|nr:beta-agarase [Planctomycetota bacterium]